MNIQWHIYIYIHTLTHPVPEVGHGPSSRHISVDHIVYHHLSFTVVLIDITEAACRGNAGVSINCIRIIFYPVSVVVHPTALKLWWQIQFLTTYIVERKYYRGAMRMIRMHIYGEASRKGHKDWGWERSLGSEGWREATEAEGDGGKEKRQEGERQQAKLICQSDWWGLKTKSGMIVLWK